MQSSIITLDSEHAINVYVLFAIWATAKLARIVRIKIEALDSIVIVENRKVTKRGLRWDEGELTDSSTSVS